MCVCLTPLTVMFSRPLSHGQLCWLSELHKQTLRHCSLVMVIDGRPSGNGLTCAHLSPIRSAHNSISSRPLGALWISWTLMIRSVSTRSVLRLWHGCCEPSGEAAEISGGPGSHGTPCTLHEHYSLSSLSHRETERESGTSWPRNTSLPRIFVISSTCFSLPLVFFIFLSPCIFTKSPVPWHKWHLFQILLSPQFYCLFSPTWANLCWFTICGRRSVVSIAAGLLSPAPCVMSVCALTSPTASPLRPKRSMTRRRDARSWRGPVARTPGCSPMSTWGCSSWTRWVRNGENNNMERKKQKKERDTLRG